MTRRHEAIFVSHGALGSPPARSRAVPYVVDILQRVDVWPAPASIAVGAFGTRLAISAAQARGVVGGLLVTAWGNMLASWIAPPAEVRGLALSGWSWNGLVYLLFVAAVVGALVAMTLVLPGASGAAERDAVSRRPARPRALLTNRLAPGNAAAHEGPRPARNSHFLTVSDGPSSVWGSFS